MNHSPLRTRLDLARRQYARTSYPGNLAADVLSRQHWTWRLSVGGAIAAAVLLMAFLVIPSLRWRQIATAPVEPAIRSPYQQLTLVPNSADVPSLSDLSEDLSIVPVAQSLAVPGMPSLDLTDNSSSNVEEPTTMEAT
jgi:hypothetical protein